MQERALGQETRNLAKTKTGCLRVSGKNAWSASEKLWVAFLSREVGDVQSIELGEIRTIDIHMKYKNVQGVPTSKINSWILENTICFW